MQIEQLNFSYGARPILRDVSLRIKKGAVTTLIGANGCGKTTLLRLLCRDLKPQSGRILLDGIDTQRIRLRRFSQQLAIVHQKNSAPNDLTVERLVSYGRTPHLRAYQRMTQGDWEHVRWAMEATGLTAHAQSAIGRLSGGERQRAFLAMALAQRSEILLLDEPTTFLDVRYQVEILRLVRRLNEELGLTIVMVLHDINQALVYSDEIAAIKDGTLLVHGAPNTVIDAEVIEQIYSIRLPVYELDGNKAVFAV